MSEELTLSIEKLVYGGDGLAHAEGGTVFVPYVLPGEAVQAPVRTRKKNLIWTGAPQIAKASPYRQVPPCPHFQKCGGCHYQHVAIGEQVRLKKEILRETLMRLGGIRWEGAITEHTAEPYLYRNRAQWALREGKPRAIGYFLPESSIVIPIDECAVLSPRLAEAFSRLQEMTRSGALPSGVQEIEAFADSADDKVALNIAFARFPKPAEQLAGIFRGAIPRLESLLLLDQRKNRFELTGPGYLFQDAGGFRFRVSHLSFFQVNRFLLEELLRAMTSDASGRLALDLYAGVGFFTLPLAKRFEKIVAVDANLAATRDLLANADRAGITVESHNEHVEKFVANADVKPDLIVLDPPRSGLGPHAAAHLAKLGAPEIRYLSCDPSTLARDLAILAGTNARKAANAAEASYAITEVHLFDLFPQTFHIETLVRLKRAPGAS
jgi:23S rRNA (uracil1939-C5)-methyltransferase